MSSIDSLSQPPSSPAAALLQWIESQSLSRKDASLKLQWAPPELSMVLNGKRPISERMARDLAEALSDLPEYRGWTADDWMELQREYTIWITRPDAEREIWAARDRVGVLCDADIVDSVASGLLRIDPFDEECVQPASYDFKPGIVTWFRRQRKGGGQLKRTLVAHEEVTLIPGDSVHIELKEWIHMPANIVGRLAAPGWLVGMGIHYTFGLHLEPGWAGNPFFTLNHFGDEEVTLFASFGCASAEFEFMQRPARKPYNKLSRKKPAGSRS